jgi:predicted enzyme related to lactoylglutathione lyase
VNAADTALATARPAPSPERVVQSIGRALAVVPSLRSARDAWTCLGFRCGGDFVYQGCRAFDVELADGGVRVLRPDSGLPHAPLREIAERNLEVGAGLIGWTWGCRDPARSRTLVESGGGTRFHLNRDGSKSLIVPESLTAGAVTILEKWHAQAHAEGANAEQPNGADHIDHLVLMVGDADATANAIGKAFRLKPRARNMKTSRYAFCKVGSTVLEIVGPPEPDGNPAAGRVWGITFGVPDMDRAVDTIRAHGVDMPDAHDAVQGGRIVSVPTPVGGIQIAFMGR